MYPRKDFVRALVFVLMAQLLAASLFVPAAQWKISALVWFMKWRAGTAPIALLAWLVAAKRFAYHGIAAVSLDGMGMALLLLAEAVSGSMDFQATLGGGFLIGLTAVCYITLVVILISLLITRLHDVPIVLIRAPYIYVALRHRGYDWLTFLQARELWELVGSAALRLPPWSDVGTVPGVSEGNMESIGELASLLKSRGFFGR